MKKLAIGISGSIAAYKIANTLSLLRGQVDAHVLMTDAAQKFIGAQTFLALTGNPVVTSLWEPTFAKPKHIDLADEIDGLLLAPATANLIGKLANGIADEPVSTLAISVLPQEIPVMIAPAMNTRMFQHPATQENLAKLESWGMRIIAPGTGDLACGWTGVGRLAEPEVIAAHVREAMGLESAEA